MLSELAHNGKVAISNVKRGASPFYYDPNNPASLEKVAQFLGEKDERTYQKLKKEKILRADAVDPLTRVGLSQIKDYAKPVYAQQAGEQILFYRYFLISQEEALQMIKEKLEGRPKPAQKPVAAPKPAAKPKVAKPSVRPQPPARAKPVRKVAPAQRTLTESTKITTDDEFLKRVLRYCRNKKITVKEHEVVRKRQEVDLVVVMQTSVGKATYFVKAKSKKKSNDGDVASALLAGQRKQLPAIYLTTGEVTKKAKEMPELKAVIIKEIKP
jgi:hypothetical protein